MGQPPLFVSDRDSRPTKQSESCAVYGKKGFMYVPIGGC
jgi:hypothetical protein